MPDYSIALQNMSPQIQSPNELMTNAYAMQNARQANELNMLKMNEYKSGLAEQDKIKNELALAQSPNDVVNVLTKYGKTKEASDYAYRIAETGNLGAKTTNLGFEGQKIQISNAAEKQKILQSMARDLSTRPSDANIMAHAEDIAASPLFTPEEKAAVKRRTADLLAKPMDQRVPDLASAGATAGDLSTAATAKAGQAITMRGQDITASTAKAGQDITMRGQNLTDYREKQRIANDQNPNIVASTLTDEAGNVTQYNKFGALIGIKPNVGKPSAQFSKTKAAKQQLSQDLDLAINELENATKKGGLIETATGSGLGALRDMSAGFIGKTTAGAEALGALQPIYDKVLKMVPRFEGPQSDKDTASYNLAAGDLGNAAAPTGKKLAAAKTILRLMKDRKAQFLTRDMAEGGTPSGDGVDSSNPLLK